MLSRDRNGSTTSIVEYYNSIATSTSSSPITTSSQHLQRPPRLINSVRPQPARRFSMQMIVMSSYCINTLTIIHNHNHKTVSSVRVVCPLLTLQHRTTRLASVSSCFMRSSGFLSMPYSFLWFPSLLQARIVCVAEEKQVRGRRAGGASRKDYKCGWRGWF